MKTNSNDLPLSCFTNCKVMTVCLFKKNCTINIIWWKIKSVSASKSITTGAITFKDSFCFLPFSLASFPRAFELVDLKKRIFSTSVQHTREPILCRTDPTQQHLRSWQYESWQTPRISRLVSRPVAMKSTAFLMSNYPKWVAKNFEKNFLKRRNLILWSNVSWLQVLVNCIGKDIIWELIVLLWNQQVDGVVHVIINCRKLSKWLKWMEHTLQEEECDSSLPTRREDCVTPCRESRGTHGRDTHTRVLPGWFWPCDPDRVRISWLCMAWLSLLPSKPQISSLKCI